LHFEVLLLLFFAFWGFKGKRGKLGIVEKRICKKIAWIVLTNIEMDYRRMELKGEIRTHSGSHVFALHQPNKALKETIRDWSLSSVMMWHLKRPISHAQLSISAFYSVLLLCVDCQDHKLRKAYNMKNKDQRIHTGKTRNKPSKSQNMQEEYRYECVCTHHSIFKEIRYYRHEPKTGCC